MHQKPYLIDGSFDCFKTDHFKPGILIDLGMENLGYLIGFYMTKLIVEF